ncbi:MAG: RluA family pseudouridine synthase [Myxococcales bacterium]|nr:RluA family pseudouridine synthase [Myxococcales bacterium]MCB9641922.1 RluA family pseudouridine synthase [Myxococcales bacterium]
MTQKDTQPDHWSHTLVHDDRSQTIAALLRSYSPNPLSWNAARALVQSGKVFLDDERLSDPAWRPQHGHVLHVKMSTPRRVLTGELAPERILWVDKHLVVIDKPTDLLSYAYAGQEGEPSAELFTRGALQHIRKGRAKEPLFLVHRLDKDSSGVMLFARNREIKDALKEQFATHQAKREYRAIVAGHPKDGTIRSWLVDDRGDGYRGSVPEREAQRREAKEAITHVACLEQFAQAALISCRLETGRTHQIRIHLSEAGCPLLGDKVYTKACKIRGNLPETPIPSSKRLALHALRLHFIHPVTKQPIEVEAPFPSQLEDLLTRLRAA